ncbi:MAG TPA: hypothetical protein VH092_32210 [Urbifossiella sp.]|jgi:hypothetical protein|nr:hypothetical protein [Urbifossiella sp.]
MRRSQWNAVSVPAMSPAEALFPEVLPHAHKERAARSGRKTTV